MAEKSEHLVHELAAYEAALRNRERKIISQELERYKRNLHALLPVENPTESDFPGCYE